MRHKKNEESKAISFQVAENLTVAILPSPDHEFIMSTKQVALGYGISSYTIRRHSMEHSHELIEGKHYVKGVSILNTLSNAQPHQVFWTKRGIVRLGFFIKSERAKLFRDWAEELVLSGIDKAAVAKISMKRNHNRLTQNRLVDILADVCRIDDKELRLGIVNKLMQGEA